MTKSYYFNTYYFNTEDQAKRFANRQEFKTAWEVAVFEHRDGLEWVVEITWRDIE